MASEGSRIGRGGLSYALVTLAAAAGAAIWIGGPAERAWGIGVAWAVQAVAFARLEAALRAARNATGIWVAGMFARGGGLAVTGLLAYMGAASRDLPIAYGIAMLALLLLEAGWLAGTLPPSRAGDVNDMDRTHSTG